MTAREIVEAARALFVELDALPLKRRVLVLNSIRRSLHKHSPFKQEPVDCVLWMPCEEVKANDYNPNTVAPPEMLLLERSITADGYTQPIVAWRHEENYEVIDGFHRNRVGRESATVNKRVCGYLPLAVIRPDREGRNDRIAATIRHNRARGKHKVESMSDIVVELKRRNWSGERIGRELGMEQDEVLRLCQVTGLAEMFTDQEFSKSWDVEGEITETDFKELTDDAASIGDEGTNFRTVNTSDPNRIFHTYDKWECHKAGFYNNFPPKGMTKQQCEEAYKTFLSDLEAFRGALRRVISEWKHSCEHYLTNASMNRIAWLGQASMCIATGVPSAFRSGFFLLSESEQTAANKLALKYLNRWLKRNGRTTVSMEEAYSGDRQSDIY